MSEEEKARKEVKFKVELTDVRLSFPRLFKAKSFEDDQDPRYEASFLLDPTREDHAAQIQQLKKVATEVADEKWGRKKWTENKNFFKGKCFGTEATLTEVYDGYADMFWVRTSKLAEDGRPLVVDQHGNPLTMADGKPYAGCYVTGTLTLWCQDNKWGKRINANLRAVKFDRDGDAFSANSIGDAASEFSDMSAPEEGSMDNATNEDTSGSFLDD
jgi:hypothetical protein